jgi:hypothetical protein
VFTRFLRRAVVAIAAIATLAVPAPAMATTALPPITVYTAPTGSGILCVYFAPCSLGRAQQRARELAPLVRSDIVIRLAGGTYQLNAPLNFTTADSGRNGHVIRWQAAPGQHPVLSGGVGVTGWHQDGALWSAPVPADLTTRQLYADGTRLDRAQGGIPAGMKQTATGYSVPDATMASWRNPGDIEFVLTNGHGSWSEPRCDVAGIQGTEITMRQPCWDNLKLPDQPRDPFGDNPHGGFPSYPADAVPARMENAFELLSPGEWYLDNTKHVVYYQPRAGEDVRKMTFVAAKLDQLVKTSTSAADPLHDVSFEGLEFAYATWLKPSSNDGFVEVQANFTLTGPNASNTEGLCGYSATPGTCPFASWTRPDAAVDLTGTRNVSFLRNTFDHLGGAGLGLQHGVRNVLVEGNTVTDVSGIGILLGAADDQQPLGGDQREIATGTTIRDNYLHHTGVDFTGAPAIVTMYSRGTTVTHNEIGDVPYSGISAGWGGWRTNSVFPHENPNINADNVISGNMVYRDMLTRYDGGAVYTNGPQGTSYEHGLTIAGNVNFSGSHTANSIYDDEGGDYITIDGNVQYNDGGGFNGGCSTTGHLRRQDNYHVGTLNSFPCAPAPVEVSDLGGNKLVAQNPQAGEIPVKVLAGAGLEPAFRYLTTSRPPVVVLASPDCTGEMLISGSGFTEGSTVSADGKALGKVTYISSNHLAVTVPPGTSAVSVTTAAGTSTVTSSPCAGLSTDFANTGITSDGNTAPGDVDGFGYSYSADAFAAQGVLPGGFVTAHDVKFTWPTASTGSPDNAIAAGQNVGLIGSSSTLGFLLTSTSGTPDTTGTGIVNYTDGTTQPYTVGSPNWEGTPPTSADPVITTPYRNGPNGRDNRAVHVFYAGVTLDPRKTVRSVKLPDADKLHIFAVALGGETNLALGKPATASSEAFGGLASRAVDGDTNGSFDNNSVSHTDQADHAWWQVDLGAAVQIGTINVWNRTDCCPERLDDFWVFVSDTPFDPSLAPEQQAVKPGVWSVHRTGSAPAVTALKLSVPGRYVMVQLAGTNYLALAEVQVFK